MYQSVIRVINHFQCNFQLICSFLIEQVCYSAICRHICQSICSSFSGRSVSLLHSCFFGMSHNAPPQRNGCSHPNNIPFTKLANHCFRSIFKNVFAPNSPFETCPIRECFLSLYPVVGDVTNEHTDFRLLFRDAEKYRRRLNELSMSLKTLQSSS